MKLFLATLLAVLAVGQAQRNNLGQGVAHQAFKTAVNKLNTGTTTSAQRTQDAARCAKCLTATAGHGGTGACTNTCRRTAQRAYQDDNNNRQANQQGIEDYKTTQCGDCLVRNHQNGDTNVNSCHSGNDFACTTKCRTRDLDKILTYIYQTNNGGGGGAGGFFGRKGRQGNGNGNGNAGDNGGDDGFVPTRQAAAGAVGIGQGNGGQDGDGQDGGGQDGDGQDGDGPGGDGQGGSDPYGGGFLNGGGIFL